MKKLPPLRLLPFQRSREINQEAKSELLLGLASLVHSSRDLQSLTAGVVASAIGSSELERKCIEGIVEAYLPPLRVSVASSVTLQNRFGRTLQ